MSVGDISAALNEDTGIFAFLPIANFVFLLIVSYTDFLFGISIVATITSSAIYNIVAGEPDIPTKHTIWIIRLIGVIWAGILVFSMWMLTKYFQESWIMPEVLFFVSLAFITLLGASLLMSRLEGFENPF